jgi:hypothetical protein
MIDSRRPQINTHEDLNRAVQATRRRASMPGNSVDLDIGWTTAMAAVGQDAAFDASLIACHDDAGSAAASEAGLDGVGALPINAPVGSGSIPGLPRRYAERGDEARR